MSLEDLRSAARRSKKQEHDVIEVRGLFVSNEYRMKRVDPVRHLRRTQQLPPVAGSFAMEDKAPRILRRARAGEHCERTASPKRPNFATEHEHGVTFRLCVCSGSDGGGPPRRRLAAYSNDVTPRAVGLHSDALNEYGGIG
jgi:hypothetical protein